MDLEILLILIPFLISAMCALYIKRPALKLPENIVEEAGNLVCRENQ